MTDQPGVIYVTCGGIAVSLLTAFWPTDGWWLVSLVLLLVAAGYVLVAVPANWPLPGRSPRLTGLLLEAFALSEQIAALAAVYRRQESDLPSRATWDQDVERMLRRGADLRADYQTRFASSALSTFRRLKEHGAHVPPRDSDSPAFFAHESLVADPVNLLGVEAVARTLAAMSAELQAQT